MMEFVEIIVAILVAIFLGCLVRRIISLAAPTPNQPSFISTEIWKQIIKRESGGAIIGILERFLSLIAFWVGEYSIIAGWLAFKLASKWEVWKNIIQVPNSLDGVPALNWYAVRREIGSWILTRYLVGTLINILIGFVAGYCGKHTVWIYTQIYG